MITRDGVCRGRYVRIGEERKTYSFYYETHIIFFFNDTATTEIYTLSLHDALPISFTITKN